VSAALLERMTTRHHDEIDRAVLIARRAATAGRVHGRDRLTRLLYQRWYLGRPPSPGVVPAQREAAERTGRALPWRSWSPGWATRQCRGADLMRLYLSCAPHTSLHAVTVVTDRAAGWAHPWLLTSRSLAQPVAGPDSTCLLFPVRALDDLAGEVDALVGDLQPLLAPTTPALTLRIGRGAGLAQNPADGRSFGAHRCAVIAEAVLADPGARHREAVESTLRALRRAQVDPQQPHRALGASWAWARAARAA